MGIIHNSKSMKELLSKKSSVKLENGQQIELQASGVIFGGKVLDDPKDVPSDEQIADLRKQEAELRRARHQ